MYNSKVKYLGHFLNGYPFAPDDWTDNSEAIRIVRIQNLTQPRTSNYNRTFVVPPERYAINKGDILISWSATLGAFRWDDDVSGWLNQHIYKATPKAGVHKDYLYWCATEFMARNKVNAHGTAMVHLTTERFGSVPVYLPSFDTQAKIASYLDYKIGAIDAAIDQAKQQLEHVKAYRQTVITEAVTAAPYPLKPIRYVCDIINGGTPEKEEITDKGCSTVFAWATPADFSFSCRDFNLTSRYVSEKGLPATSGVLPANTVFLSSRAPVGKLAYTTVPLAFNQGVKGLRAKCSTILPSFLFWSMHAVVPEMLLKANGTTFLEISTSTLKTIAIPCPPLPVQAEIASFLDQKISAIDKTIATLQQLLTSLPLYRQSLISDVVTGQLAVPEDFTAEPTAMLAPQ